MLAYGLRGNLYRSDDDGVSWQRIELPVRATLLSGTQAPSGVVVLVGLSGSVFFGDANGSAFDDRSRADRVGLAAALFMRGERLLLLGEDGVGWFDEAPHQVPRDRDEASP